MSTAPPSPPLRLRGDAAHILRHLARGVWQPPSPDEVIDVRQRTLREHLAARRRVWAFFGLCLAVVIACLGMLLTAAGADLPESALAARFFALLAAALLLTALAWRLHRAALLAIHGPLDAPPRALRLDPDALLILDPGAPPRRIALTALTQLRLEGHRARNGWTLSVLTLDDGAGPIELRPSWLPRDRLLHALADRLLRARVVHLDD